MKTIALTIRQFAMSPQQIVLLLRYGEESILQSFAAQAIEKQNQSRAFYLKSTFISNQIKLRLSTDTLYRGQDGFIEQWVFRKRESSFFDRENNFLAHFIYCIARKNRLRFHGIRTVHHIFNSNNQLLRRYSVTEELIAPHKTAHFIQEKIAIIADNLKLPDSALDPCHSSYTGRHLELCQSCPVRRHCQQTKNSIKPHSK